LLFAEDLLVDARTVVGRAAGIRGLCRRVLSGDGTQRGGGAPVGQGHVPPGLGASSDYPRLSGERRMVEFAAAVTVPRCFGSNEQIFGKK
jgi:hypothetical protein